MIIAATGYRGYTDTGFIRSYLNSFKSLYECSSSSLFLHVRVGDATGADEIVKQWCEANRISHHVFAARRFESGALMPGEGPARNRRMLLGIGDLVSGLTILLLGFPRTDRKPVTVPGSGTWGCMIKVAELGIKVEIPPYHRSGD